MRFLVLGLGGIGQRHVRNIRTLMGAEAEIYAYRARRTSPTLTDRLTVEADVGVEQKYGITVVESIEAGLALGPDAVLVCNPTSLHMASAIAAAEAGAHLFIEKPISHDLEHAQTLIDLVEERRLGSMVGYQMRFHPCLLKLRELLGERAVGNIVAVRAQIGEYLPGWHTYEDYRQMYAARADLGGGVVLSQIHEMDYIYWLFGAPSSVYALGGHLSELEIDVEDTASILMSCVIDGRPIPVHLQEDYLQRPAARTCEVLGSAGKIAVDLNGLTVTHSGAKGELAGQYSFEGFERNEMFLAEMRHFIACARGEEPPVVSVRDGVQSLRMALAAKESMRTGAVQRLGGERDE